ncbi:MAG: hypothetical protein WC686_05290 [Candidatus Shapirobacteria bacterium]
MESEERNYGVVLAIIMIVVMGLTAGGWLLAESQDWKKGIMGEGKIKRGECEGCYRNEEVCQIRTIEKLGGECKKRRDDPLCPKDVEGNWEWRYCY